MTPIVTHPKSGKYVAEGAGIRRVATAPGDAIALWEAAYARSRHSAIDKARVARRKELASMPAAPNRTPATFRPLQISAMLRLAATRARAEQPPMVNMSSRANSWPLEAPRG